MTSVVRFAGIIVRVGGCSTFQETLISDEKWQEYHWAYKLTCHNAIMTNKSMTSTSHRLLLQKIEVQNCLNKSQPAQQTPSKTLSPIGVVEEVGCWGKIAGGVCVVWSFQYGRSFNDPLQKGMLIKILPPIFLGQRHWTGGHYMTPTQTMHCSREIPQHYHRICIVWSTPKKWVISWPLFFSPPQGDQFAPQKTVYFWGDSIWAIGKMKGPENGISC